MRKVVILFLVLVCIVGISLSYFFWPSLKYRWNKLTLNKEQEQKDIQKTKDLLSQDKPEEAILIVHQYADQIDNHTDMGKEWLDLLIRGSEATINIPQLVALYEIYPKSFDAHEKAAILVANAYIASGRPRDYQQLRDNWKGREAKPEVWFVLDADKLLLDGKRKEAIDFLHSRTFQGKADTSRLVRLALLTALENPKEAWDYLDQAYKKDPENPEIRSYRAKLLETVGKNSLALTEYIAAVQTDPKNLYLKDQLAEFYLRQKQYPYALEIWRESLNPPSLDFVWLKALFWNKIVLPIKYDWTAAKPPKGKIEPFIEYLIALKPDEFWDQAAFEKLDNYQQYLKTQQAAFWLRLLQNLKDGNEKEAYEMLQFNPWSTYSWNPELEKALRRILLYRKTGKFVAEKSQNVQNDAQKEQKVKPIQVPAEEPFLFSQLEFLAQNPPSEKNKVPVDLHELLAGPEIFSAAMLAAGWDEAALTLNKLTVIPQTYPEWVAFDLVQAYRRNRGNNEALKFATLQTPTHALSMLIGEILIASGNNDAALEHLKKLYQENSDIGKRSAWLMSLIYIDRGDYKEAKEIVHSQPLLEKDVLGQETLARIALLEGNTALADKIYSSLETVSPEAKSYLARKAFTEKDWKKAKELTEELLKEYPTNLLLQENYKKILEEQNKINKQK